MLNKDQIDHFDEFGFVVVEDVLDRATVLDPVIREYDGIMDDLRAGWMAEGRLDPAEPAA